MCESIKCSILIIGTELLEGQVKDKHLVFIGQELRNLGIIVKRAVIAPDNFDIISSEIDRAIIDTELIIITGGLGPTSDDITRYIIAAAAGVKLVLHKSIWENIKTKFQRKKIGNSNKKQALIPEGFAIIDNKIGTACGFYGKIKEAQIIALPGVPSEFKKMFIESVIPSISESFSVSHRSGIVANAFMVSESALEDAFKSIQSKKVWMQTYIKKDRIVFKLKGGNIRRQKEILNVIRNVFGEMRIRMSDKGLAERLREVLIDKKKRIVFAESCTGGLLSKWITDVPGSSEVFYGGFVTYANRAKMDILKVDGKFIYEKGAVSGEVACNMAENALNKAEVDISIAVSGIAGPEGGTKEKPVGTVWISCKEKKGPGLTKCFHFYGNRHRIRQKAAIVSFLLAESLLIGNIALDIPLVW